MNINQPVFNTTEREEENTREMEPQRNSGDLPSNTTVTYFNSHANEGDIHKKRVQQNAIHFDVEHEEVEERVTQKNFFARCGDKLTEAVHFIIPPGGILASAFNFSAGSIGAGILALPGATNTAGLGMAAIFLIVITFFSVFSMYLLAIVAKKTQIRSFEGIARQLFPQYRYAFSYWIAFIRCFFGFGACVGYVISVGDSFQPIFAEASKRNPDNSALHYFTTTSGRNVLQSLVWLCVMLPLVTPKHIDSLRYASTVAITLMIYFVLAIIVHSCMNGLPKNIHNIVWSGRHGDVVEDNKIFLFRTGNGALGALGSFLFTYAAQVNAYEVYWDMRPELRTTRDYTITAIVAMGLSCTLYTLVCFFGYFDFGSEKLQDKSILLMYNPLSEPEMLVGYIGVLTKLCVSYALMGMGARNSLYYLIGWQSKFRDIKQQQRSVANENYMLQRREKRNEGYLPGDLPPGNPQVENTGNLSQALQKQSASDDLNLFVDNIPFWMHLIAVVSLALMSLMFGLFIPTIKIAFGFAGSISGSFLSYLIPALFYIYSGGFDLAKIGWFNYVFTYLLLISGVAVMVYGTGATIYGALS